MQVITNTPDKSKSRQDLQREIRQKEAAVNYLARRHPIAPPHLWLQPLPRRVAAPATCGCSPCHIRLQARTYSNRKLPPEDLKHCLYSIADNNAYLYQARLTLTLTLTPTPAQTPNPNPKPKP